ncbi:MAG: radical SAM protein [Coriobacteriales bacterium]|jgi:MoaA/NifB/PqqE/SkfB family radical SAM enzyme|nr:radical SAM protein [Coriobacteriales bacterium]
MGQLGYYARWYLAARLLGRLRPLQTVIFISDRCNLRCRHCNVVQSDWRTKSYAQIEAELLRSYAKGSRIVDFEGGEPLLWRDPGTGPDGADRNINDLIELARRIGYFSTTVTTNGTLPIEVKSDLVWISLDGLQEAHDDQRGQGVFARVMAHLEASSHPNLNLNMVVTKRNFEDFVGIATLVADHPKLRKFSYSFYVPYSDRSLMVTQEQRDQVTTWALELKAKGFPLMNSKAGIKLLCDPRCFYKKRQCWVSNFILADGQDLPSCPGEAAGICADCGFGMGAEMTLLWNLHPSMLRSALAVRGA